MTTYIVNAERDGKYWHLRVPAVDRSTQARTAHEIDDMARDLIAIMTETEPGSFDIEVIWQLPGNIQAHMDSVKELRDQAAHANSQAAAEIRVAAKLLKAEGLGVRDIGRVMGVSYQRASQLVGPVSSVG